MKKRYSNAVILVLLVLSMYALPGHAQFQAPQNEEKELAPVSRTYAIKNATIIQGPGRRIDGGTVVIKNGLIASVGKSVPIPADAIIIKGDSLHVYAGFIDGLSRIGVAKPKEDANRERPKDPGNPTPEAAGVTPQNDVRTVVNPTDKTIEEWRALGFTTAQIVPYGNLLPGQAAVVQLTGKSADAMVLAGRSALYSELTGAQRVYPNTIIAVLAKWKELYRQASQTKMYESTYATNRAGLNRPASDRILEAFYPVIDKRQPVLFEADRYLEIQRVLALQKEFGFQVMLGDVKEGWDAVDVIKSSGAKIFLSLEIPEEKKEDKKKAKQEDQVSVYQTGEKEALEKRQNEFRSFYISQAATYQKAGIVFGFSTMTTKSADVKSNIRRIIKAGLSEDQALAALTTNPAQLLGFSDRLGTLDAGKIANVVITDKSYFHEKSNVRYVFVDGVMYQYEAKAASKGDPNAKVQVDGTWSVTVETPQSKEQSTLTIKKDGDSYSGSIIGGRLAQAVQLDRVSLNGNQLTYSYTMPMGGNSLKVDVEATVEGSSFKGTATAGSFGTFPVEGKKDPNR